MFVAAGRRRSNIMIESRTHRVPGRSKLTWKLGVPLVIVGVLIGYLLGWVLNLWGL
jgi:hypothetical protein